MKGSSQGGPNHHPRARFSPTSASSLRFNCDALPLISKCTMLSWTSRSRHLPYLLSMRTSLPFSLPTSVQASAFLAGLLLWWSSHPQLHSLREGWYCALPLLPGALDFMFLTLHDNTLCAFLLFLSNRSSPRLAPRSRRLAPSTWFLAPSATPGCKRHTGNDVW